MCIISMAIALGSTFAALGTTLGASAGAAAMVGGIAAGAADLALTGSLVGGVISTVSGMQQSSAAAAQAKYLADQEERNAFLSNRQAENLDLQSNQERSQLRTRMLAQRGDARASYAAGGVVLGAGTPSDYEADIADAYDLDSRNLNYDISSRKWQKRVQAVNSQDQSAMYRAQASGYQGQRTASLLGGMFSTFGDSLGAVGGTLGVASKVGKLF